jgi:hypothetical protein
MSVWDSLKIVLVRLLDEQPGALTMFPDPRIDRDRRPPFRIGLAAWAGSAAGELHDRFGTDVELTVGAQSYPSGTDQQSAWRENDTAPVVDPGQIGIELGGPLSVQAGHTARQDLLLTNRTESALAISTNGQLTAVVVDPGNDRVIGGFAGAQHMPLVVFRIPPGATRKIPLLVGTASFDRALGYTVPPGDWAIRATLVVDGNHMSTPTLPLTVID